MYGDNQYCVICTDSLETRSMCLPSCGHIFHRKCLIKWGNKKYMNGPVCCPICRTEYDIYGFLDKRKIKNFKQINMYSYKQLLEFVNTISKNSFSEDENEEIEVFSPLLYKFLTSSDEDFTEFINILIESEYQRQKYKEECSSTTPFNDFLSFNTDDSNYYQDLLDDPFEELYRNFQSSLSSNRRGAVLDLLIDFSTEVLLPQPQQTQEPQTQEPQTQEPLTPPPEYTNDE